MTRIIAIVASLVLAGCVTATDTSCTAFGPISYSAANDTAQTVLQVRQHNAAWASLCR